ncbi:2OG-Fe(II) oxygenase [Idiomarina xiamenensis]|uniref:Prolyl 4-hydroxylase alpha subunit n=1 Tax=Idiomarina xiamenensis 10-D-4 TaxID=740709 RepID=K2JDK8_9GAMM|nr:2OG-Fe(II) oxygenase [Idiomarina xiamenensis]EKE81481.1 prolyl 4-hydroxylase alpha subunit [Idiomarina xiamenensis 10-D-4]
MSRLHPSIALIMANIDTLVDNGYLIVPDFLAPNEVALLANYAQQLQEDRWQHAAIGREHSKTTNSQVRRDRIKWLDNSTTAEADYLALMESLRLQINRALFMGLFDYECHLAWYPPGSFYRKHLDAFKGRSNRVLTSVFYLNQDWSADDGGELVMYGNNGEVLERILPEAGKLVLFLSDVFVHEVLPGKRQRLSISGWFRVNNSIGGRIDPSR